MVEALRRILRSRNFLFGLGAVLAVCIGVGAVALSPNWFKGVSGFGGARGMFAESDPSASTPQVSLLNFPDQDEVGAEPLRIKRLHRSPEQGGGVSRWLESQGAAFEERWRQVSTNLIRVSRIEVAGNARLSSDAIRTLTGVRSHDPWWAVSEAQVQRELKRNAWIESSEVSWGIFPTRLAVKVQEAEPWLVAELAGRSWLISSTGQILQPLDSIRDPDMIMEVSQLPRLSGVDAPSDTRFRYAAMMLRVLEAAGGFPFKVETYTLLPEGGIVARPEIGSSVPQVVVMVESLQEAENALRRLKLVLRDLANRGETRREIDLRFTGQAVLK